jgi:serralysin
VGFENVFGSEQGDLLLGNDFQNVLAGGGGNDAISGRGGDDLIRGGAGADSMQGGDGRDGLDYTFSAPVQVDLASGRGFGGDAAGDTFSGFENLFGGDGVDVLLGDDAANVMRGNNGNDLMLGRGGNDTLFGSLGSDAMTGGAGADTFRYITTVESQRGPGFAGDRIGDFQHSVDRIDLSSIDAREGAAGNQAFSFIGGQAFTAEGQVRLFFEGDHTVVQLNTAGTLAAESEIELAGHITLSAGDFIL